MQSPLLANMIKCTSSVIFSNGVNHRFFICNLEKGHEGNHKAVFHDDFGVNGVLIWEDEDKRKANLLKGE